MNPIRKYLDKIKPKFEEGGKLHAFRSVFDGFETFMFVPNTTSKTGVNVHDAIDSKRIMSFVVIALVPALLFGMYNVGYQNAAAAGQLGTTGFWDLFMFGFLAVMPKIIVSYVVGLGIEFIVAQKKNEEIHEGYLVTGIIIPLIVPVTTPLWMLALACAFAVIFAKEIFGGTGMNIFNVALIARAFLFFSYPSAMTGDAVSMVLNPETNELVNNSVWVAAEQICGFGYNLTADATTMATPLGVLAAGQPLAEGSICAQITGLIPGAIGETSVIAIGLGGLLLLFTGVASWKTMLSVFAGGALTALLFNSLDMEGNAVAALPWYQHLVVGGFAFGAVFMATDPVTSARTECGKWLYGFLIGVVAITVRVLNPGYPEGMMLAILLMNVFAALIDYYVVDANIKRRAKRASK